MAKSENIKKLEAAVPSLVEKLALLKDTLSKEECYVFNEIIIAASIHAKVVQAHEEGDESIVFSKPKDTLSTVKMKPISPLTDFSYDFQDLDFVKVQVQTMH